MPTVALRILTTGLFSVLSHPMEELYHRLFMMLPEMNPVTFSLASDEAVVEDVGCGGEKPGE